MSQHLRCSVVAMVAVGLALTLGVSSALAATSPTPVRSISHQRSMARANDYAPRQALVRFSAGVSVASARAVAGDADARLVRQIGGMAEDGVLCVLRSESLTTRQLVAALSRDPRVACAEPDYSLHTCAASNDPSLSLQWALPQISAPAAWDATTGAQSVVIASLDTGVDYTHPDLAANMWTNPAETAANGIDDDANGYVDDVYGIDRVSGDTNPMDGEGHGTHTAGTIAAVGDNGVGVAGVAWQTSIMALRFLDEDGSGYISDAVTCINYAIAQKQAGVNVVAINASWGSSSYSTTLYSAIQSAGQAGIIIVAAAGNEFSNIDWYGYYPAAYDCANIVSVASTNRYDALGGSSNYGAASVDLAAPGEGILGTVPYAISGYYYASYFGTSMAAAHVSGAVALCAALDPSDTLQERIDRVLSGVDPVPALADRCATGGRLNLSVALGGTSPDDDAIPGVALGPSPAAGTLHRDSDAVDVYRIYLAAGEDLSATLRGDADSNFDLRLFAPGTTDLTDSTGVVAEAIGSEYPDALTYEAQGSGAYYLAVIATSGAGSYELSYGIRSDDDIPGKPLEGFGAAGSLSSATDTDDLYAISLAHGQQVTASITGPQGADFRLLLYDPAATSIFDDYPLVGAVTGAYPRTFSYRIWEAGTYYLDAWAASGSGDYAISYSVTPAEADDSVPGLDLSLSPITGSISPAGDYDVYRVSLRAGQSGRFTVAGPANSEFDLFMYAPATSEIEKADPVAAAYAGEYSSQATLNYVAPASGDYYLLVYGAYGSGDYALVHTIDLTPPITSALGLDEAWHSSPVTVTFAPADFESGVAGTEYDLDGAGYVPGIACWISGNRVHTLSYRSVDNAGNVETAHTATVRVDAGRPRTYALANVSVLKGRRVTMRFRANDVTPQARFVIRIYKGRRLIKTLKPGLRATNTAQSFRWVCNFARGTYTWKVYATDLAGNAQRTPVGYKTLVVK